MVSTTGNYTYGISDGQLNVSGSGFGSITFDTPFDVVGDFTAIVEANWSVLPEGQMGLTAANEASIEFVGDGYLFTHAGSDVNATLAPVPPDNIVSFEIARQGDTVITGFPEGDGAINGFCTFNRSFIDCPDHRWTYSQSSVYSW